jgi:hypothetical protein
MTISSPLLFQPDPFLLTKMPSLRDNNVPRFLFRVHTPESYSQTSLTEVVPQVSAHNAARAEQDIFTWDRRDAARILNVQLRWWLHRDASDCSLVCWTSSLLFALQYGLHLARRNNPGEFKPSQITLLIVDTRSIPDGAFVKDLDRLNVFSAYADLNLERNLAYLETMRLGSMGYYFGEYLSQGCLNIKDRCDQATMQDLIDCGLFKLLPELKNEDYWDQWAKRVVELRQPFSETDKGKMSEHYEVRTAIVIAERCYPGRWALPVATMLLALKPRMHNDRVILDGFASTYSGK